jgi:hypothetical protein
MRWFTLVKIFLLSTFFINSYKACSQNFIADTSAETSSLHSAVNLYHQFLSPETGLYNGSQYAYNAYYPFVINQGDPFFQSKHFDTGAVFYNNVLYEKVPLLYDIVKEELLINDPTNTYIVRLNNERVRWFIIFGHTFIRLNQDSANNSALHTGFYDLLYNGNTALYKKVSKIFKENSASFQGINKYIVEFNEYFIKKNNQYYTVKNKRSLLIIMNDKKKEVGQFIKKSKLNLRKDQENALTRIVTYYDAINNNNTKVIN